VTDWVTRLTQAMPGAQVTIGTVSRPPAPLAPGGTAVFVFKSRSPETGSISINRLDDGNRAKYAVGAVSSRTAFLR